MLRALFGGPGGWLAGLLAARRRRAEVRRSLAAVGVRDVHYSTPRGDGWERCRFCGEALRRLTGPRTVVTPRGESLVRLTTVGYACLRCAIAAAGDGRGAPSQGWAPAEEFRP